MLLSLFFNMCVFKSVKPIHLESDVHISLAPFKSAESFNMTLFCGGDRCHGGSKKFKSTVTETAFPGCSAYCSFPDLVK